VSYETLLAEYSCRQGAIELLRQYRPYLELIPSMRRPEDSLITIPLPLVRIRSSSALESRKTVQLACDLAILIVSKSIVKYRQTEFHFRNSLHFYFERLILLG